MKNVCVFLGANYGANDLYKSHAISLAREMGQRKLNVVYSGSTCGLMGEFADTAIESGCDVVGVITEAISKIEKPHQNLK